ncbi:hypothetical protein [Paracoccus aminophilus]|uniref:Secreted protein n=1 Tax=Paracoccus aminophilus JCM 7686 TaxID=1367847 RepID=S5XQ93_PARAH|nr:hypothetical protein [Paracoccus aminophilus]AGT07212.1 hypothetical protein JCM7686_0101 [Paracoccus aminophilus JCM 7686]
MKRILLTAAMVGGLGAGMAWAETGTDPDWPCIQRKQPHLSLGQVWTGPVPTEAQQELAKTRDIANLAEALEQRRVSVEDAEKQIGDYAKTASNDQLTALMVAIFDRLDSRRASLIEGIGRYGHKQVALAQQIDDRRGKMEAMQKADKPDFDAIDKEEAALDWDTRIFTDRQQSLTYVCETPVILEQRAFSLGRAIAAGLKS